MRIVKTGNGGVAFQIDHFRAVVVILHHVGHGADGKEFALAHGDRFGEGIFTIDGMKLAIHQNQICFSRGSHNCS
ncbi:hypothetical protein D3C87_2100620 [compost metagenome]